MALHFCGIEDLEHLKVVLRDMNDLSFTLSTRSLFILNQFLPATGIELPPGLLFLLVFIICSYLFLLFCCRAFNGP